jgi:hypothetical protein
LQNGERRIYAFVPLRDHLYVNYWTGSEWTWDDLGNPFPPESTSELTTLGCAITYQSRGKRSIREFIIGTDQQLYERHWDGMNANWTWGPAQGGPLDGMIGVASYAEGPDPAVEEQWLYLFFTVRFDAANFSALACIIAISKK